MKMLKRVAAGLMAAVMALGMLTACSSDKGTPQNWVDSTLAKMVANAAGSNSYVQSRSIAMTYTVVGGDGTEKYLVGPYYDNGGTGNEGFIGTMEHGWLSGSNFDVMTSGKGKIVDHTKKSYKEYSINGRGSTGEPSDGTFDEKGVWALFYHASGLWSSGSIKVVVSNDKKYKGQLYHTETISVSIGDNYVSKMRKYDYTFYFESNGTDVAEVPAYIGFESEGEKCMVKVKEYISGGNLPQKYTSLLTIDNSYAKES